jgi:DNA-binding transcriptional LysR family regulator
MDLHKLKAFIVVAENLNFRRSAEILGMSQPPLTRMIAAFEKELDTALFERSTRSVRLTASGVVLLREAREIMAALERIERDVRSISKIKKGALNIGFSPTVFFARFSSIMSEFKDRFPYVKTELHQDSKSEILKGLQNGRLDIGFLDAITTHKGLQSGVVQDEVMGVLLNKDHKLARKKEISFAELKDETIILHPRSEAPEFHDRMLKLIRTVEPRPKVYIKGENEVCPILVATKKGVSLTIAGSNAFAAKETTFVPVKNLFLPVSVFWREESVSPSLNVFLGFVLEKRSLQRPQGDCLMDTTAK